jgi:extracellular elastinolytic metalloproteinase
MRYLLLCAALCCTTLFGQTDKNAILGYFLSNGSNNVIRSVTDFEIVSEAGSQAKGVRHLYIRQLVNGIPVNNGLATVTLKDGKAVRAVGSLKPVSAAAGTVPALSAEQALRAFLETKEKTQVDIRRTSVSERGLEFFAPAVSRSAIPVELCYLAQPEGTLKLSWNLSVDMGEHWWSARIDAADGAILEQNDWIRSCNFGGAEAEETAHISEQRSLLSPPPPPGTDQYRVYALPVESPAHGDRSLVINPSDPIASPFGWHDTDGEPGDEYTITRGNNVYASDDIDDDNEPGYSPNGGGPLNFDFPYDSAAGVTGNLNAVITNLFYMNNMIHDIWFHYGFDEISGNFQAINYSGDGLGDDFVFADAQDGSGTNNANFSSPPDGFNPRMQMFLWSENNVSGLLTINSPSQIAQGYDCSTAGFGPTISTTPITADLVLVNDGVGTASDGCQTILNAGAINGKIALVRRGECTFAHKVEACEDAGAVAVIVINNVAGAPISMGGESDTQIPSVMVSQAHGNLFVQQINNGQTVNATIVNPGDLAATDSDFDNAIIAHEYGHGISTRLTGGAGNSDCLFNEEQMGEGWSDWFGLMITIKPGDLPGSPRGVGTYVLGQENTGTGIRPAPYSTSFAVNNYTYGATNSGALTEPHGIGFVWASMLWDLNWALIDQYGFDADVKTGDGGNNIAMALVIEGLKLQPCNPGFVDGRNAILEADELLYDGAHRCLIWEVFARRGLGFSADQGSPFSRSDQVQAFDQHPSCLETNGILGKTLDMVQIYPNPASGVLNIDMSNYPEVRSVRITDLQGKVLYDNGAVAQTLLTVDVSPWRSGIYLVSLVDSKGAKTVEVMRK